MADDNTTPALDEQRREELVVHLKACVVGLKAGAVRLEALPEVYRKVRDIADALRTIADARRARTVRGPSESGQPEAGQHGHVNGTDARQSGSNEFEDAVVSRLKAVEERLLQLEAFARLPDAGAADRPDAGAADRPDAGAADRLDAGAADRLDAGAADRLDAVAGRLDNAVADRLEPAADPLVAAATILRAAADPLVAAATGIEDTAFVLPAGAAKDLEAAADEVKDTVAQLSSARRFRDCAVKLSDAARLLPGGDAHPLPVAAGELTNAADELRRVIGEYPTPAPSGKWDVAVLQLRSLAQNEAQEIKNVRHSLTEADADIEELRRVEQTVRNIRGDILFQLCGDYLPIAFTQIRNLLDVESDPRLKKAQEVWLRKEKDLSRKVVRRETARADVMTQIYNIIGWYAVYLGVVLTAVTQLTQTGSSTSESNATKPVCGKVWFPILLTAVGTIVIFFGLLFKFKSLNSLEDTINSDRKISAELQQRILRIERKGLDFDFVKDIDNKSQKSRAKKPYWKYILVIIALIVVAASFIISYYSILCDIWE